MKKLMTVIGAAVAAFGLYAADTAELAESNIDFSKATPGAFDFGEDKSGDQLWYLSGNAEGTITEGESSNFLALEAEDPVYRTAAVVDAKPDQVAIADAAEERGGIIFDQKVKFSAFDEAPTDLGDAKIAVWVKAVDADDNQDGSTNLMITCSKLNAELKPKSGDEVVTVDAGAIDVDDFHQLTITVIEAAIDGSDVVPGFKIALDGTEIALAGGLFPTGDLDFGGEYTAEGAALIKANKLFPSLVDYTTANAGTIQGVAFKGTGAIESIDISASPVYDVEIDVVAPTGDGWTATVVPTKGKIGDSIVVTYTANAGKLFKDGKSTMTATGTLAADGRVAFDEEPDTEVQDAKAAIGTVLYLTLKDAVEAVGANETIELLVDCASVGIRVEGGKNFTIDFAGKKVTFNKPGAGSKNTQTQAFQLIEGSTIVFKNGTICCSEENKDATWVKTDTEKGIAMIIQNYANLTLENMTIDAANIAHNGAAKRYAMSNNSGTVTLEDTTITVLEGDIAFDTCKYATYELPTVEVKGDDSVIGGDIELSGGNLTLTAGELNGELIDAGIGNGVITKADAFAADAPAGYLWKDGVLVKMAEPTATVTPITAAGYDVAVQFEADDQGDGYDDWQAKFILTSDVAIGADEIALGGSYEAYESGKWIDIPFAGCEANEPVSIAGDLEVTVDDLFTFVQTFKCGVKNIALKNDATFSLKLVIVNPDDATGVKEICKIENLKVEKKQADYPSYIPTTDDEAKGKWDTWAQGKSFDDVEATIVKDAFLLNCDLNEVDAKKAAFVIKSITQDANGNWVFTVVDDAHGDGDAYGNGYIQVVPYTGITVENGQLFKAELVVSNPKKN